VMAMLTRLAKRAAFHATVAIGGFQRRAGGRFPRYASFCRRAAGYVAYAMAGEPFRAVTASPPSGAPAVQVPGTALGRASHLEVAGAYVICIEEPVGPINAGFFHLRGWLTSERTLPDIRSVVNGKPFPLCRYARPDVQGDYPDRQTTGFSVFVRLGEIPNPEYVTIEILAGADRLIQQIEDATAAAVEAGQRGEEARREKREWVLPRIACLDCGGDLNRAAECCSCGRVYEAGGILDCIPPEVHGRWDVEFSGAVCSHGYDGDVERVIAKAEASGGKVLDCGAGLRPTIRRNVVTTEIFPYPTTDVLAVNHRLPFKDSVFDAVLSLHVLEHVADPFACAKELCRVLKPGGTLFAVTPMIVPEHGYPHHFFNPTREGLARLFDRTSDAARVFVPAMGHPINALWAVLAFYRDSLPELHRDTFLQLTVRDILARSMEEWLMQDVALALSEEGRARLAGNFCIEFVK